MVNICYTVLFLSSFSLLVFTECIVFSWQQFTTERYRLEILKFKMFILCSNSLLWDKSQVIFYVQVIIAFMIESLIMLEKCCSSTVKIVSFWVNVQISVVKNMGILKIRRSWNKNIHLNLLVFYTLFYTLSFWSKLSKDIWRPVNLLMLASNYNQNRCLLTPLPSPSGTGERIEREGRNLCVKNS